MSEATAQGKRRLHTVSRVLQKQPSFGDNAAVPDADKPISEPGQAAGTGCLRLFFFVFFAAGCAAIYFLSIKPIWQVAQAGSWMETPCRILSSQVAVTRDSDGDSYKAAIEYAYVFEGDEYRGSQARFTQTSGRSAARRLVSQYPPGTDTLCFVNPAQPSEAVLDRSSLAGAWQGLFGLIFVAVGLGGIIGAPHLAGRNRTIKNAPGGVWTQSSGALAAPPVENALVLKPRQSPVMGCVGISIFAVFWNAITWTIIYFTLIKDGPREFVWFAAIILGIFALLGLLMIAGAVQNFLALFNPRPVLTLREPLLLPGGELALEWSIPGGARRLRRLSLLLKGREEATYSRGTTTVVDKHVFFTAPLVETTDSATAQSGSARLTLPLQTMHSFKSAHNAIVWEIKLHAVVPMFPDIKVEYPLQIAPRKTAS